MPAPNDINSNIALRKGWIWEEELKEPTTPLWGSDYLGAEEDWPFTHWRDPEGKPEYLRNYVGTLEGLAGLMRELNELRDKHGNKRDWFWWTYSPYLKEYQCGTSGLEILARSSIEQSGHCVGEVWMSEIGKGAADARA